MTLAKFGVISGLVTTVLASAMAQANVFAGTLWPMYAATIVSDPTGIRCLLPARQDGLNLRPTQTDWSQYTHLQVTVHNNGSTGCVASFSIISGTNGWGGADFYVPAGQSRTIAIPFDRNPAWKGFNLPGISDSVSQAYTYGTIYKNSIQSINFWNLELGLSEDLTLTYAQPVSYSIPLTGIIDQYGQYTVPFSGKVLSDSDLQQDAASDALLSGQFPWSDDGFGGVAGTATGGATGRWKTAKQNGRWYLLDPSGNRFFSTGIVGAGSGVLAQTDDRASVFAAGALPATNGPFGTHYHTVGGALGFSFYDSNVHRKFSTGWMTAAKTNTMRRMRTWGFNTVGPIGSTGLTDQSSGLATMPVAEIRTSGQYYRTVPCPGATFPMPDPYDPTWSAIADSYLTPIITQLNQNPNNVGMFIDNELPWADSWQVPNYQYYLAFNVLSAPADQPAKQRFYKTLLLNYRTIQKLNIAWRTNYLSWNDLLNNANFRPSMISVSLGKDLRNFVNSFATQYYSTIKSILTKRSYKGLYLGTRYFYYSPDVVQAATRYCDVVSFNAYDQFPSNWRNDLKTLDFPVMIGEFSFASAANAGIGGSPFSSTTEQDQADAYSAYTQDATTFPNLVGLHWYKWEDDPLSGRLGDNSNTTYGLVTITDRPHPLLINAVTVANTAFQARLLQP